MRNCLITLTAVASLIFTSCTSNEIGSNKDVNPESVYFDYRVWGDESKDDMTVFLQYRFSGPGGTTLVLEKPAKVELDGKEISADSSRLSGAYYEVTMPVKDFIGRHSIAFTDLDGKQYKEDFDFQPITLKTNIPEKVRRNDLVFDIAGLDPVDYVRVLLTDTSFASPDINKIDMVRNGRVIISKKDLQNVVNGPVYLEFYKEENKPLKEVTKEGGNLYFSYGLKRDFSLQD